MKTKLPEDERWVAYYQPITLESELEAESTLFAVRMFEDAKLHGKLIHSNIVMDDDVLRLLGFTLAKESKAGNAALLRKATAWQCRRLEELLDGRSCKQAINLRRLCEFLHLNDAEFGAAYLGLMLSQSSGYSDLLRLADKRYSIHGMLALFARLLDVSVREFRRAIRSDSRPTRMGLLEENSFVVGNVPTTPDNIRFALEEEALDAPTLLRSLIRRAPKPRLTVDDFAHVSQLSTLLKFLSHACETSTRGVNILLYGPPGTGKTELARMLAAHVDGELFEVPNEDDDGDAIRGPKRFSAYVLCQQVLAEQARATVLFDEAEDVLTRPLFWLSGNDSAVQSKSWVNELLESNAAPTIWTCNEIDAFDPACLRRFDMVVEMRVPPRSVRRRIVDRYFKPGEITAACADRIASAEELPPAAVERAARVVHAIDDEDIKIRDATSLRLVQDTLRAMGMQANLLPGALPSHYDLAFVNADRPLGRLLDGLRRHPHARLCLYGPPGTGKTAFAHYLGRCLDLPVLLRRGSDLLGPFVGMTERLIAEAFGRARDEQAILVIDEADSFLRDRTGARASWEVTQVNELLTQMEAFEGIFIASTNLMESLDAAALRRFDFKSRFGYLKPQQRRTLLERICGTEPSALDDAVTRALDRMDTLTPGDYANVLRQLSILDEAASPARIVELLAAEAALKPEARRRPIGFAT